MRGLTRIALVCLGVAVAHAQPDSACGSPSNPSLIYVTLPPNTITETVYAVSASGSAIVSEAAASSSANVTTVTSSILSTVFISVVPATTTADEEYSFTVKNGTTTWLGGKTPPATAVLVTTTSFVTLQPILTPPVPEESVTVSTTHLLITSTKTITKTSTLTVTNSAEPTLSAAGAYTGLKPAGWNATMTTLSTAKAATTGISAFSQLTYPLTSKVEDATTVSPGSHKPLPHGPSITSKNKALTFSGTAYAVTDATNSSTYAIKARQIGAVVVATMDGILVSWTNSYNGPSPTTSAAEEGIVPFPATYPPYTPSVLSTSLIEGGIVPFPVTYSPYIPKSKSILAAVAPEAATTVVSSREQVAATRALSSSPVHPTSQTHVWIPGVVTAPLFGPLIAEASRHFLQPEPSLSTDPSDGIPVLSVVSDLTASPSIVITSSVSSDFVSQSTLSDAAASTSTDYAALETGPPSSCGVSSVPFTIDFDDLPHFSVGNDPGESDIPPIFNPYRKMYFEKYFGYVPPPSDPYLPHSPPQLAVYTGAGARKTSPKPGQELPGEIGAGPRSNDSAYWVDAFSVWLGCDNGGPDDCTIEITGYTNGATRPSFRQTVIQPPCPQLQNCSLALIEIEDDFRGLTGLQITAMAGTIPVDYYIDDLALGWTNNTCLAQEERSGSD